MTYNLRYNTKRVIYNLFDVYICSTPLIYIIDYFNLQNEQGKIGFHLMLLK
jgi:hypothetical protein